ncbi:MAG: response regulator transcription factor [Anaerolineae bacterium]
MVETPSLRILLVDDHLLFRKGLRGLLLGHENLEVIGEAGDGLEALEKARELMPDLILMDIGMPGCDGVEATRRIKEEMPHITVVMLTVSDSDEDLFEAIKSGARGYLLKNLEPDDLFEMLDGISGGEAPISGKMAAKILEEFSLQAQQQSLAAITRNGLTAREVEVLKLVAQGATNREIASALFITENTVRNHLKNILAKLHLKNRIQAAVYAARKGLNSDTSSQS